MAMRFMDSFDHVATADMALKGWVKDASSSIQGGGRFSNCFQIGASNAPTTAYLQFDAQGTWVVGSAVNFGSLASDAILFMGLSSGATMEMTVALLNDGTGRIGIYRGNLASLLAVSANAVVNINIWHHIQWKTVVHNSSGTSEVLLNGVSICSFAGDTSTTGGSTADRVYLGGYRSQGGSIEFDDLYICDGTGGVNDTFLGDLRVQNIMPSGNGNSSVLVGSDGNSTDNYLLVDETTPNADTDYVQSATAGDKDTYAYGNITPTAGTVKAVQISPYARKDDAGVRSIVSVARETTGPTEEDGATNTLTTSYVMYPSVRNTKPGGGAWSIADVNAAEFGVKVTA